MVRMIEDLRHNDLVAAVMICLLFEKNIKIGDSVVTIGISLQRGLTVCMFTVEFCFYCKRFAQSAGPNDVLLRSG